MPLVGRARAAHYLPSEAINKLRKARMDWTDYLRDQATKYRQLAETAEDLSVKEELLDLAAICEEAANNIEDRMPGG